MEIMKLKPGSVSPLGILNDDNFKVTFYIDRDFLKDKKIIGVHPNENTATLWLKVDDLLKIIREHGTEVEFADIS